MTSKTLTQDIRDEAVRLYLSGLSTYQVATALGIGATSVCRALDAAEVTRRNSHDYAHHPMRKRQLPLDEIRELYESGETVAALADAYGVGFGTMLRRLKDAGASMRPNSWDQFSQFSDQWVSLYVDDKLPLDQIAALDFGPNSSTIRRYIHNAGVKIRCCNVVQFHNHISPIAGKLKLRGAWERAYAKVLDRWYEEALIKGWNYESEKIPLEHSGKWYLPDFVINQRSGTKVFHEVKGFCRPKAAAKITEARASGVPVILITGPLLTSLCNHYQIPFRTKHWHAVT